MFFHNFDPHKIQKVFYLKRTSSTQNKNINFENRFSSYTFIRYKKTNPLLKIVLIEKRNPKVVFFLFSFEKKEVLFERKENEKIQYRKKNWCPAFTIYIFFKLKTEKNIIL